MIERPQVAIAVKHTDTTATITLVGELDVAVVVDVREVMKLVVAREGLTAIHVDTTGVTFIDSAGLKSLIQARQRAHDYLLSFTIAAAPDGPVSRLITLCGLDKLFAESHRRSPPADQPIAPQRWPI